MTEEAVVVTRADAALLVWVLDLLDVDILEEQRDMLLNQFARVRQSAEARGAKGIDAPALKRVADALGVAIKTVERRHNRLRVLLDDDDGGATP